MQFVQFVFILVSSQVADSSLSYTGVYLANIKACSLLLMSAAQVHPNRMAYKLQRPVSSFEAIKKWEQIKGTERGTASI